MPSTPKHGNMKCDLERVKKNAKALEALQRLSEDCGLDHISVNGYSEHVRSTLPDQPKNPATPFIAGGGKVCGHTSNSSQRTPGPAWTPMKLLAVWVGAVRIGTCTSTEDVTRRQRRWATQVDQLGLFTTAAPGISISNLAFTGGQNQAMIGQIRAEQILDAALYDFLFCCSDRHAQNIFIDENATIQLIDNDLLLGGAQKGRFADGACTPSSLFLPSNMESWRVRNSPSRLGHLGTARAPLPPSLTRPPRSYGRTIGRG